MGNTRRSSRRRLSCPCLVTAGSTLDGASVFAASVVACRFDLGRDRWGMRRGDQLMRRDSYADVSIVGASLPLLPFRGVPRRVEEGGTRSSGEAHTDYDVKCHHKIWVSKLFQVYMCT